MKKIVFLIIILGLGYWGAQVYADKTAREKMDQVAIKLSPKVELHYERAGVILHRLDLVLDNVGLRFPSGRAVGISRVVLHNVDLRDKFPHFLDVELYGLSAEVNQENFGQAWAELDKLGIKRVRADVALDYVLDQDSSTFDLLKFQAEVEEAGDLDLSLRLESFDFEKALKLEIDQFVLAEMKLAYRDGSLVREIVRDAVKNEAELVGYLEEGLKEEAANAARNDDEQTLLSLNALLKFIREPDELFIKVKLKQPSSFTEIMSQKKISAALNLFDIRIESD